MALKTQLMAVHAALVAGDHGRALALAEQLLRQYPEQIDALQLFAGAALAGGRADAAAQALQRAAQRAPRLPDLQYNLGIAEQACGRFAAARAAFERCLALRPAHVEARLGHALATHAQGDAAAATGDFRAVLQQRPGDPAATEGLALALCDLGQREEAIGIAEAQVVQRPLQPGSWRLLARLHEQVGRIDAALAALRRGVEAGCDPSSMAMARGHLAFRTGRWHEAAASFGEAARLQPASAEAWNNLAAARTRLDRVGEAIDAAGRAAALAPRDGNVRMTLAAALSHSREPPDLLRSLALCLEIIADSPENASAHDCAAKVLLKQGQLTEARRHAERALALQPADAGHALTLARVLEHLGELAQAEALLEPLAAPQDASPALLRQLGHVRLRCDRAPEALPVLDAAWRRDPADQTGIAERALAIALTSGWAEGEAWLGLREWVQTVDVEVPSAFPTLEAFLRALADDIRGHSQLRFEPVGLVARGGYLTGDLLADDTPAIRGFAESLRKAIRAFIDRLPDVPGHPFLGGVPRGEHLMHVWATRVHAQGVIDTHLHEGSWISGAFYVQLPPALGNHDTAGWIEFGRPAAGLPSPPDERLLRVRPEPGMMLFFPSYLYHRTLPFEGEGERISISFDLAAA